MTGSLTSPPWKGGNQTEWLVQCDLSVGGGWGAVVVAGLSTRCYGELMLSGVSWEALMDGGLVLLLGCHALTNSPWWRLMVN